MSDRWNSPPQLTEAMRNAAYRKYCEADKQGYFAFQNLIDCFRAAFETEETVVLNREALEAARSALKFYAGFSQGHRAYEALLALEAALRHRDSE